MQQIKHTKHILFYSLFLSLLLFFTGCQKSSGLQAAENFDDFIQSIFVEEVQTDGITLNYTLAHPENYGITEYTPSFGEFTAAEFERSNAEMENYLAALKEFPYDDLTKEQQLTYDIFKNYLELELSSSHLTFYAEALGPTTGLQAQLPVLLSEYNFIQKQDVDNYLLLIKDLPRYFKQLGDFEAAKSKAGLFMSDRTADSIISQCQNFIANTEDNLLIEIFNDKMEELDFLSNAEKKEYKEQNKALVLDAVIPAYELLIDKIDSLKGTGTNEGGLCNFPDGKEYYEYLVASTTGSSKSIMEIDEMLSQGIANGIENMIEAADGDSSIFQKADEATFPLTDPTEIMDYLKTAIKENYPELEDVNCSIKYVHKSLEKDLSPAFYLTPQLDNYTNNSIYINGYSKYDLDDIFPTLAHEGYPGHLYQSVYFSQQSPAPLRMLLSFGGYTEGWATYVEMDSYSLIDMDQKIASIIMNNQAASLCMYAQIDLGIHYLGWGIEDTKSYLENFGITSDEVTQEIHQTMIAEPANYMKYALGYLEIAALKEEAATALGEKFCLKDWHEFFLKTGPAQFEVIESYMDEWIKEQK